MSGNDYSLITEIPGNRASTEQLEMIHTRYALAASFARNKDVLEAAAGPGRGLGFLAHGAKSVIGGDIMDSLVKMAQAHYAGNKKIKALAFDAQSMPFPDSSFDLVIMFEAIYYLPDAARFVAEAGRVLRPGGVLLVCSVNREWADFNPSPFSTRYYSAKGLSELLEGAGFKAEIRAGFEAAAKTPLQKTVSLVKRFAVRLGLIPKSMKGKAWLKRLFYGKLAELGPEIDDTTAVHPLVRITSFPVTSYKVLYAIGTKPAGPA